MKMKDNLHPAVQILVWVLFSLIIQRMHGIVLLLICVTLLGIALRVSSAQMLSLLRRTRWIMVSLLVIYSYTTPGVAIFSHFGLWSPTWEGLSDGVVQLARLMGVLAALAILLVLLSQAQLISGLYSMMHPLDWFGMSRERFAVRLALTLGKAETAMRDTASDWRSAIADALNPNVSGASHVEFEVHAFSFFDIIILLGCILIMVGVFR